MENNSGFGFHQHPLSPNLNLFGFPSDTGHPNMGPVFINPPSFEDSTLRIVPPFPVSGVQQSYRMPYFHQAFVPPVFNAASMEKFPTCPKPGPEPAQKRFLVFDQSGDKTTLIYSSAFKTPVQFGARWAQSNFPTTYNLSKKEARDSVPPLSPNVYDEYIEDNSRDVTEGEMHEDTEELNALLSSDNYTDYSEDDEETSTGHSPSTMTNNGIQDVAEETGEEVDSFAGPIKRRKLLDGGYEGPTASSLKTFASSALEDDDAESSCGNGSNSWTGGRRSRMEKIRETVSVLQRIIPSVNGEDDAAVVIDEAIRYLRFLKVKAKALGLDTL